MATGQDLEKHFVVNGMNPEKRVSYKGLDIYLADSGPHYDVKDRGFTKDEMEQFGLGYYMTVWAIGVHGKVTGYIPLFFEALHDMELSDRKTARLNSAELQAKGFINHALKVGLFNKEKLYAAA
jgi:hypothetical protein